MKSLSAITLSILLITLVACGDYDSDSSNNSSPTPQEEQSQEGTFRDVAKVLNPLVTFANAAFVIVIQNDQFNVEIFGSGPATTHIQVIRSGTSCPTIANDSNRDGVIDNVEGTAIYGTPILFLDSDLASDGGVFPSAANYRYSESASFSQILGNLNIPTLNLEGKVITIHGVPESTDLPSGAQGPKSEFPIACGILIRR